MEPVKHGPGRPLDLGKRQAIFVATRELLMRDGTAFTMEAVAARAGVSKQTVYNCFPTKQALIETVLEQRIETLTRPMAEAPEDQAMAVTLTDLATRYMDMLLDPGSIALLRVLLGMADSRDTQTFGRGGPVALHRRLSDYLRRMIILGRLQHCDTDLAAEHFFGLLKGNLQLLVLLGCAQAPTLDERERRIDSAVDVFLRAYAPLAS